MVLCSNFAAVSLWSRFFRMLLRLLDLYGNIMQDCTIQRLMILELQGHVFQQEFQPAQNILFLIGGLDIPRVVVDLPSLPPRSRKKKDGLLVSAQDIRSGS